MEPGMTVIGPLVWLALTTGVQTGPAPPAVGASLLCGPVTGRTVRNRDDGLSFCSDEITPGVITELIADDAVVRIRVTARLADAMRDDRVSGDELVTKWLRRWRAVTNGTTVTLLVESNNVEIVKGSTSPDHGDQVTWPSNDTTRVR
jgi:hypothetical protein